MQIIDGVRNGFSGRWLSCAGVRAFVIANPYPRVIAFETADHASIVLDSHGHEYFGIRSWFMEPEQTEHSGLPALLPAQFDLGQEGVLTLRTGKDPVSGLSLRMSVAIDPDDQSLIVRHEFRNETARTRELAPWGIVSVTPQDLIGFTKWRSGPRHSIVVSGPARASDPVITYGFHTLAVDFSNRPQAEHLKIGTDTDCGWVACANDTTALWVQADVQRTGRYPEGGSTVTMFRSGPMQGEEFAEIESVGPLQDVGFGQTMTMTQKLSMSRGLQGKTPDDFLLDCDPEVP